MAERRVRRSWDVSKRTADSLNKLQLISGVEKSDLVDIAITFLFQSVIAVRTCTGISSRDIIESIAKAFPADIRNAEMQVESGPIRIDLSKLLQMMEGGSVSTRPSISDEMDMQQTESYESISSTEDGVDG